MNTFTKLPCEHGPVCGWIHRLTSTPKALYVSLALSSIFMVTQMHAQRAVPFFIEDFEDGSADDGVPVTWIIPPAPPSTDGSTGTVSDGSYVLSTTGNCSVVAKVFTEIGDVSIRALVRGLEMGSGNYVAVFADLQPDGRSHWALVTPLGLHTGTGLPGAAGMKGTVYQPGAFDPFTGDVNIQFDVAGTKLNLTVWRLGATRPSQPQLTSTVNPLPPGSIGFGTDFGQIAIRQFIAMQVPVEPSPKLNCERLVGDVLRFTVPTGFDLWSNSSMTASGWSLAGNPNRQGQLDVTASGPSKFLQLRSKGS